jgi:quercetin dioxygenase-like cupin family protein
MDIARAGSRPSVQGPEEWFTGTVRIDPLFDPEAPARTGASRITFEPGARTARDQDAADPVRRAALS